MLGAEAPPGRKGPDDLLANAMFQTILRLIYAGFSGLVYAGLDLCSVIKRKVQAALNERMQEYKRQIDQESRSRLKGGSCSQHSGQRNNSELCSGLLSRQRTTLCSAGR
ncbi:hypothetical protein P8452_20382 [Trifolium repens]|nr:hypothetical protein P8452_20382 [Trifolium repens]